MRQSCATTIWLTCFFSLMVGSRSFVFAQEPPQTSEKERGIELYRKGDFNGASESLESYLKLNPQKSENVMWREQLETLRFYAQKAEESKSDVYAPRITAALRPTILYREGHLQGLSHGLTEQVIVAAHKIRFTPAMRDGKPVSVIGSLEFTFNLY
jgi:hypothetical protein